MDISQLKREAGVKACQMVEDGMTLGVGTGSTVAYFIEELGRRHREEGLCAHCVPTSIRSAEALRKAGMEVCDIDKVGRIDLTVDGADAVDPDLNGLKGLGGALLWEKIVAENTDHYVWIVDERKLVPSLRGKVCLEVVKFGSGRLLKELEECGLNPSFKQGENGPALTDSSNYLIELDLGEIKDPAFLATDLKQRTGVIEHGMFLGMVDEVIVARENGVEIIKKAIA
ncbi:MAG: ribose-5-phosphate isomerase RpiA [Aeriscardovia sp.]|nr:ribose-5-phosphate isomerase RpiA [Aeriscardovia sp.]